MVTIHPARESDVVLAFLRAEKDRWHNNEWVQSLLASVGVTNQQLVDADLQNDYYNVLRGVVLDAFRGYLRKQGVFMRFPKEVCWRRVDLGPSDLHRLRFVKSVEWMPLSNESRTAQAVVDRLARNELPVEFAQKIRAIQHSLKSGETLPELVAVEGEGNDLILLEGAHRTTAYVALRWKANVQAIVGTSPLMRQWAFY